MTKALTFSAIKVWRDYPREAVALSALGVAAALALAGTAGSTPSLSGLRGGADSAESAPAPPPLLVRELAPEDALSINQAIPIADSPNPAARPFAMRGADSAARARALECLASAVYYEAGNEPADGQRAVAQVVLNRVRHPAFPASVCGVVYQGSTRATGCQFTFTCDGSLSRRPSADGWARSRKVAEAALAGAVFGPAGYATHYHADYVVPYWASSLAKNAVVGAHIFYRWAGGWGRPAAFAKRYSGHEPDSQALRTAALSADAAHAAAPASLAATVAAIPGAELKTPQGGQLAIRFNLAARKAVEEAPRTAYVERFEASDNLRWSLGGGAADEKPLGLPAPASAIASTGSSSGGAGSPAPQH
ncbi:MAG TPA: cell wall hydrolase [Sphingomicrobium sp.]|nr:cell wall hydrolase [Sphingomicrobium sp.]